MSYSYSAREQIRKSKLQKKKKTWLTIGIVIAVLAFLITLISFLPRIISQQTNYQNNNGFELGDKDAPITVEIFSSYTCSHCKNFAETNEKAFIEAYVETGKVLYRYINLPSPDDLSLAAAEASYCAADQNRFFDYKQSLYNNVTNQNGFATENLIRYAAEIGLDENQFANCLESDTYAQSYLDDRAHASAIGIQYTPSFSVNGLIVMAPELENTVEELLAP